MSIDDIPDQTEHALSQYWQELLDVQSQLAEYLRTIGEPDFE